MIPSKEDVAKYLVARFGEGADLDTYRHFRKLCEESDELGRAIYGLHFDTGEEPPPGGWERNLRDEVADVVIVCLAIAAAEEFDLAEAVAAKWARRPAYPPVDEPHPDDSEPSSTDPKTHKNS